jgi:hypothetical protein
MDVLGKTSTNIPTDTTTREKTNALSCLMQSYDGGITSKPSNASLILMFHLSRLSHSNVLGYTRRTNFSLNIIHEK